MLYPYILWSDGSQMTVGGHKFHRVNISPANWPLHLMRSKQGHKLLALLPVVPSSGGEHKCGTLLFD